MRIFNQLLSLKQHAFQSIIAPKCFAIVGRSMPIEASFDYPRVNDACLLKGTKIFLAVFPKSGSTYLASLLSNLTGTPLKGAVQLSGHNEQDICELRLRSLAGMDAIIQQHAKGTFNNVTLLKKYRIKPVVLVRNIYDAIVSNHDHFRSESDIVPMGYVHPEYWNMSEKEQLDFIIANMVPWYLNFYVSWRDASTTTKVLWLTYEDFFSDQITGVQKIMEFYGMQSNYIENDTKKSIESMPALGDRLTTNRLNVGKSGRGELLLSHEQKRMVSDIAKRWHLSDGCLEIIGIKS